MESHPRRDKSEEAVDTARVSPAMLPHGFREMHLRGHNRQRLFSRHRSRFAVRHVVRPLSDLMRYVTRFLRKPLPPELDVDAFLKSDLLAIGVEIGLSDAVGDSANIADSNAAP